MRRGFVIGLCILNGSIALGLLWSVSKSRKPKRSAQAITAQMAPNDSNLITQANKAGSEREALYYLQQVEDPTLLEPPIQSVLAALADGRVPAFDRWPYHQAVLQIAGGRVVTPEGLLEIGALSLDDTLPITLRDGAFRSFIENAIRFAGEDGFREPCWALVDRAFEAGNSLSNTSLEAEHYLRKSSFEAPVSRPDFTLRLSGVVEATEQPMSKRLMALSVLAERNELNVLELEKAFQMGSEQLKTGLLRALAQSDEAIDMAWLDNYKATNLQQESLLHSVLGGR